mmetsp:Transcript_63852/g.125720  ORF Transcript_63852/g.125720 Transcript_63852/m.125720 type:complete len:267 (-) Transcript_63852:270-1070(-)
MDEGVVENHPHVRGHALPGQPLHHLLGEAHGLGKVFRSRRAVGHGRDCWKRAATAAGHEGAQRSERDERGLLLRRGLAGRGRCADSLVNLEDLGQLLTRLARQDERLGGHVQRIRESHRLRAVGEVRAEASEVRCLDAEIRLHPHMLGEVFGGLADAHQADFLELVSPLREPQEQRQVGLQERLNTGPQAFDRHVGAIGQGREENLGNAAAGVGLGLDGLERHLVLAQGVFDLARAQADGPSRRDLVVQAAEGDADARREEIPSGR